MEFTVENVCDVCGATAVVRDGRWTHAEAADEIMCRLLNGFAVGLLILAIKSGTESETDSLTEPGGGVL